MATTALVAADRPYVVGLASNFSTYPTYTTAQAGAIAVSAANSSAQYYVCRVDSVVTGPGRNDLEPGVPGPGTWVIIAVSGLTTYLPKATAVAAAFTLSGSNSNAAAIVAKAFQVCTGP